MPEPGPLSQLDEEIIQTVETGFETVGTVSIDAPARKEGKLTVVKAVLRRGTAHTLFGARRPKLVSS